MGSRKEFAATPPEQHREVRRAQAKPLVGTLHKYGYPPDKREKATQTVLQQAELLRKNWAAARLRTR